MTDIPSAELDRLEALAEQAMPVTDNGAKELAERLAVALAAADDAGLVPGDEGWFSARTALRAALEGSEP